MEENNVQTGAGEQNKNFDGHPTQAHMDHANIMKAHEAISDPARMEAVHALHAKSGGLISYLKKKQKDFSMKEAQQGAPGQVKHEETPAADKDADMSPNADVSQAGHLAVAQ